MNATLEHYTTPARDNAQALHLTTPNGSTLRVFFSYKTPIAFALNGSARVVRVNDWSTTTGKHLSAIDGGDKSAKKSRVSGEDFTRKLSEAFATLTGATLADFGAEVLRVIAERETGVDRRAGRLSDGLARDGFREIARAAQERGLIVPASAEVNS